ncbi:hypothetical protein [Kaistia nematophila]|uniref:Uncharacterized protein n=1 Tax=Kaistia nematophila TaxID=2994654 RepID=A0A9X3E1T7_9HYPH|nr:hypothetical protein [Kaistia nematophila]MCX5569864.1 hypothetical protein [Kaistia nematophila]
MRTDKAGRALFERAVTLHREDCSALAEPARFTASAVALPGAAEEALADRVVVYRVEAGKAYEAFRRLIGQLAGLLILVQASGRREVLDLPDLPIADERWRQAGETLAALDAPGGLAAHKARLDATFAHIGAGLRHFRRFGEIGGGEAALAIASNEINAAYQALRSASDMEAGLSMVDFSQACCSCMVQPTRC